MVLSHSHCKLIDPQKQSIPVVKLVVFHQQPHFLLVQRVHPDYLHLPPLLPYFLQDLNQALQLIPLLEGGDHLGREKNGSTRSVHKNWLPRAVQKQKPVTKTYCPKQHERYRIQRPCFIFFSCFVCTLCTWLTNNKQQKCPLLTSIGFTALLYFLFVFCTYALCSHGCVTMYRTWSLAGLTFKLILYFCLAQQSNVMDTRYQIRKALCNC